MSAIYAKCASTLWDFYFRTKLWFVYLIVFLNYSFPLSYSNMTDTSDNFAMGGKSLNKFVSTVGLLQSICP